MYALRLALATNVRFEPCEFITLHICSRHPRFFFRSARTNTIDHLYATPMSHTQQMRNLYEKRARAVFVLFCSLALQVYIEIEMKSILFQ